jgi:hypothetical protein
MGETSGSHRKNLERCRWLLSHLPSLARLAITTPRPHVSGQPVQHKMCLKEPLRGLNSGVSQVMEHLKNCMYVLHRHHWLRDAMRNITQ